MKKQSQKTRTVALVNPLNSEMWYCKDFADTKEIEGVPYVTVFKPENEKRTFLMRKDALRLSKPF